MSSDVPTVRETHDVDGEAGYRPGACNIGAADVRARRRLGLVAGGATAVVGAAVALLDLHRGWALLAATT